jgi:Mn-dependent DtxR family transcriptional regulator
MTIQESGETYLETILLLRQKQGYVRSVDIAAELGYSKPSISRAMGILKRDGYITIEKPGYIHLTDYGENKAQEIYDRHKVLTVFFSQTLGVDPELAEQDACRIEHIISGELVQAIKRHLNS